MVTKAQNAFCLYDLIFIWPPSVLSTQLGKCVYFLLGETVYEILVRHRYNVFLLIYNKAIEGVKTTNAIQTAFPVKPCSNLEHVHRNTWKILTRKAASFAWVDSKISNKKLTPKLRIYQSLQKLIIWIKKNKEGID